MKKSKILLYDIESGPNLGYVYGKYDQTVITFEKEWDLLSFSYKWLGEKKTIAVGQDKVTEEALVLRLWNLFDQADIVIAHNGDKFDQRMMNVKFMQYGLTPPSPYKTIDTLKVARRYFKFNSNKLDDLGKSLGVGRKAETGGFDTWLGCMNGEPKAWKKMLAYNKQDVILLEQVYLKLLPWMDNHPALNVIEGRPDACPKCGGTHLQSRGLKHNKTTSVARFQCQDCFGWCQARTAQKAVVEYVN
jgi:hypothetical protein